MNNRTKKFMAVFSSASFLNDFGSDMIYPVWPLFVTSFLGANVAVLGLIEGIGNAVVSVSQAGSGYLSDRLRKRKVFMHALWVSFGKFAPFYFSLGLTILATVLMLFVKEQK